MADDTAAFQEAADAGYLHAPALRPDGGEAIFKVTSTINLPSCQVRIDGTIDATDLPPGVNFSDGCVFEARGTISSPTTINTRVAKGKSVITMPNDYATGDLILIKNTEQPIPGLTVTSWHKGEIKRLTSADTEKFQFATRTYFGYAAPATIQKITPVEVHVSGRGTIQCGGVGSGHIGISLNYALRPTVEGITILDAEDIGVKLDYCWVPQIKGIHVEGSTSPSYGKTGYAVMFGSGTTGGLLSESVFFNCADGVSGGGNIPAMYCSIDRNFSDDAILDCHEPCFEWQFFGNTVLGGSAAILLRGQHADAFFNRTYGNEYGVRIKTWYGITVQDGARSMFNRVRGTMKGVHADGRADTVGNPVSHKPGLEIIGDRVEESGASDGASVTVAHATEAIVDVTTRGNLGAKGVDIINSRLRELTALADDASTSVSLSDSTVKRDK